MKWTRGTKNDDVVDARGKKSTGAVLAGGGVGVAVIVFVVAKLFGVDVSGLFGGSSSSSSSSSTTSTTKEEPPKGPDPDAELVDYVKYVMKDIQDEFAAQFQRMGKPYPRAKLILFTQAVDTKCGRSSSAIGPFYCPGDSHAYIDLSFFKDLRARFGAPGDFAQAYVLAHEVGHHAQNLLDLRGSRTNDHSVRVELQADCYAGVWAHSAAGKKLLEVGDLEEAITAAQAIGDDRLSKQAGAEVNPETFTHGSSAQRMKWFRRGFDAGKLEACDTFSIAEP
ncbi:MAG: neutral zinc metallopeptidase [Deltaproteobacteria bacterium]|nr:neutral zinc metallopeptidase [Deltaproteobacteria bacterium]